MFALAAFIIALLSTTLSIYSLTMIYVLTRSHSIPLNTHQHPGKLLPGFILLLSMTITYLLAYFGAFS